MERQPRRRRRPALACLDCRRRKIKCDRNDPCANCTSFGTQCTYRLYSNNEGQAIQQQRQHDSALGSTATSEAYAPSPLAQDQGQRYGSSAPLTELNYPNHLSGPQAAESDPTLGPADIRSPNLDLNIQSDLWNILRKVQKPGESSPSNSIHELSENGRDILARQAGLQESQVILNKTRMLSWSHWMGVAQEVWSV